MMLFKLLMFLCFQSGEGLAQSLPEIIFLEVKNAAGNPVHLEADFPYAHLVLVTEQGFLHAHPRTGVVWSLLDKLSEFGVIGERVAIPPKSLSWEKVGAWEGLPYDAHFSWNDDKFYCAELIAKLLKMAPEPMHFAPALWPPSFLALEGLPGISPGKVYRNLLEQGFSFEKEKVR